MEISLRFSKQIQIGIICMVYIEYNFESNNFFIFWNHYFYLVLNLQRLQKPIYLYLFTDGFMKISLQSSENMHTHTETQTQTQTQTQDTDRQTDRQTDTHIKKEIFMKQSVNKYR